MNRHPLSLVLILTIVTALAPAQRATDTAPPAQPRVLDPSVLEMSEREKQIEAEATGDKVTIEIAKVHPDMFVRDAIPVVPSAKGDPMVIPFIREEMVRKDLAARMNEAMDKGQTDVALALAKSIARNYPSTSEAATAQNIIDVLSKGTSPSRPLEPVQPDGLNLPPWIASNTNTIMYQESGGSLVIIGPQICREGDTVTNYPNVVVHEIHANEVVYKISNDFMSKTVAVTVKAQ